ncbi:hypothetical protein IFT48_26775 [Pseudomonas fluorescens]|uniref:HNH endonuclease n=1 Tax=Pseudomonas fluorescens TaxID=294 RepID=UPI0019070151|nr:hypothetical protein [Pseudomonas fluorescens]MBD8093601.1 hypothetical protein [Pseudomonas fluorescens]MBD8720104.1 hypothetical protein [Pseudomonas fluorescens]
MAELTREAMEKVHARYKNECHQYETHRKDSFAHFCEQDARAIAEFSRRKRGLPARKTDLWTELTKFNSDKTSGVTGPSIRKALRDFLEKEQNGVCCYCQRPLINIAHAKPIEHILPRVHFLQYTFHFWNLAVACFDCNQIKRGDVWVDDDKRGVEHYPGPGEFTEMYHPRFHVFSEHVRFIRVQTNEFLISIYVGTSDQGRHLCLNLLKDLSAREIVLNSNPALRSALEVINANAAEKEGELSAEHEAFLDALAKSTSQLFKTP